MTHLIGSISMPFSLVWNLKKNRDLSSLPVMIKFILGSMTIIETFEVWGFTAFINRNLKWRVEWFSWKIRYQQIIELSKPCIDFWRYNVAWWYLKSALKRSMKKSFQKVPLGSIVWHVRPKMFYVICTWKKKSTTWH